VAVLAVVLLVAVALMFSDPAHDLVQRLLAWSRGIIEEHPLLGKFLFMLLSAISAMMAFVSSTVFVPVAVYAWGPRVTVLLLWISWLIGGVCSYLIGRSVGRRIVRWFVSRERVDYYSSRISAQAGFLTVLLFQIALPSEIPGYVLGTIRYRFPVYLAVLAIAELPFAIGAVYLGEGFITRNYLLLLGLGAAGIAFSAFALHHLHRRLGDR
jgi:uncharacterized membrane protein YdjX (TVP38/TMEM64 family)